MWSSRFTDLVGCDVPLQQAGMGGVTTPALASAVAGAGGLGMLAAAGVPADVVARQLDEAGGTGRVGVNFLMPFLDLDALERSAELAPVVECFYGDPRDDVVNRIHAGGALAVWQVGSADEAARARDVGCDLLVVQGIEAGGHVRGTMALLPLLDAVRAVVDLPLVAAGGIGSGADMATAVAAGADAVRVGTRFLATHEADVHPDYLAALFGATADDTELTEAFSGGWRDAPHRVLRSSIAASSADPLTRSVSPPTRAFTGDVASAALYAGRSVGSVSEVQPAADVVREIVEEARRELGRAG